MKAASDNEKGQTEGIFQRALSKAKKFWPVSLLMLTFSFLHELDKVIELSAYLNYITSIWREILYGVFEVPINTLRRLINLPEIRIIQPLPEIILVCSMMSWPIVNLEGAMKSQVFDTALKRFSVISYALLAFACVELILYVLFREWYLVFSVAIPALIIGTYLVSRWSVLRVVKRYPGGHVGELSNKILDDGFPRVGMGLVLFVFITAVNIVVLGGAIVGFTELLDLIIPPSEAFKANALRFDLRP